MDENPILQARTRRTGFSLGVLGINDLEEDKNRVQFDSDSILSDVQKRVSYEKKLNDNIINQSKVFTRSKRITMEDSDEEADILKSNKKKYILLGYIILYCSLFIISYFSIEYGDKKYIYISCIGGVIGTLSSLLILYSFSTLSSPARIPNESWIKYYASQIYKSLLFPLQGLLHPPLALMYWRSFSDLLIGLRFIFIGLQFNQFGSKNFMDIQCNIASGFLEFAQLSSEAWHFCLCLELLLSIRNPFTSFKSRLMYYHFGVWSFSFLAAILIGSPYIKPSVQDKLVFIHGSQYDCIEEEENMSYTCTKYDPYKYGFSISRVFNAGQQKINDDQVNQFYPYGDSGFCWVNAIFSENVNNLSVYPWLFLYCPIIVILVFSLYSLHIAYFRFQQGVTMSLLHRLNILVLNYVNIFWYFLYWLVLFFVLVCASTSKIYFGDKPHDKNNLGGNTVLMSLLFYMISSKGSIGVIIWIIVGDLERSLKSDEDDTLDINGAIRGEILSYIVNGIRTACEVVNNDTVIRLVLTSTLDISNVFKDEKYFLLSIVLGHDKLIRTIKRQVRTAPTNDIVTESYKLGVPINQLNRTKRLKLHRNSLNIIAQKLTRLDSSLRESCSIVATDYAKPSFLKKSWNYFLNETPPPLFEEFLPEVFTKIRNLYGIDKETYIQAFVYSSLGRIKQDAGASGALFFLSENEKYMLKSCTEKERDRMIEKASDYFEHLQTEKDSLIVKIYGLYTLNMYGLKFNFMVMQNVVPKTIQEKYDLKGSWVDRKTFLPANGKQVTCKNCMEQFIFRKNKGALFRNRLSVNALRITTESLSSIRAADRKRCYKAVKGIHEPLLTQKDLDLKYKIRLDNREARSLFNQLSSDANFLCNKMKVMDYSLLVGVIKADIKTNVSNNRDSSFWENYAVRELPKGGDESHYKSFESNLITANYLYYFGIIDFLEVYDLKKRIERWFKTVVLQKDPDGISCIESELYKSRFINYVADLLDVNDDVEARI